MEKSSYCCCYSCGRFNTGERNFHLSTPHSSARTEQHTSPLRTPVETSLPCCQSLQPLCKDLFECFECEILETGDCGAATLSRANVKQHKYPRNLQCLSLDSFDKEAPKGDAPQRGGRRGGGRASSLTLQHDTASRRKSTVTEFVHSLDLV